MKIKVKNSLIEFFFFKNTFIVDNKISKNAAKNIPINPSIKTIFVNANLREKKYNPRVNKKEKKKFFRLLIFI